MQKIAPLAAPLHLYLHRLMTKLFSTKRNMVLLPVLAGLTILLFTVGCSATAKSPGPGGPGGYPPPNVELVTVQQRDVPIAQEWIGTLDGYVNAPIKAQVNGYLLKQDYVEGSFVKKDQVLFEIDPRPFQAAVDQALGQLAQAKGQLAQAKAGLTQARANLAGSQASQHKTQLDVDKYTPLAKEQAVTQQDMDNAVQNNLTALAQVKSSEASVETAQAQIEAAQAAVQSAQANVDTAKYNLGFTKLTSPIDGIAGMAASQVGSLVGPSSAAVTTVSTLDPIRANFTVSEQEYLKFTHNAGVEVSKLPLDLILSDGSTYARKGRFFFADREVNQATGSIQLTALFPNPGNNLRPGQYAKVRAVTGTRVGALLIPQRAVSELQGSYQVAVVDAQNKVSIATVKPGDRIGSDWIIEEGLKPGDRVVAEGVQKVGPGSTVVPQAAGESK
jgi:membrane fusion protein (multidrug efflux system)